MNSSERGKKQKKMKAKNLLLVFGIILMIGAAVVCTSCEGKTVEATVTKVYQPLVNGMVHTWLEVKFDDNSTAQVVLPDDDSVWNKARTMKGKKVTLRKTKEKWEFVSF